MAEEPSASEGGSAASEDSDEAADAASAERSDGPGTMAMRRLLERGAASQSGGGGPANAALQRRVAELEDALQGLDERVAALEPAVQRWTEMESRLEQLIASLRENASERRQGLDAPVPAPPPDNPVMRNPTEPPTDPALRGRRRGGGGTAREASRPSGGEQDAGSTGDPDEIDTYGLHLVSYENRDNAGPGWRSLQERYGGQLSDLQRRMATVTLPDGRTFHRLVAGPIEQQSEAERRCRRLEERGQYCALTEFVGVPS